MKSMEIVLCGNYGVTNIGDEAIREGLTNYFRKINPDAEIVVFGKGSLLPLGFRSFLRSLLNWDLWKKPLAIIRNADIFVLGGGGLLTDEEGPFVSTFWALHGLAALFLKKQLLVLGVSLGPVRIWNIPLLKFVMRRAKFIMVRDMASHQQLAEWGIPSIIGPDFAEYISVRAGLAPKNKKYAVISVRHYKNNDKTLYKKIAQICDSLHQFFGFDIVFLPFNNIGISDTQIAYKIFELMSNKRAVRILPFTLETGEILATLGSASMTLAMRLHAGILSSLVGTPFIPICYMKKVTDYWNKFSDLPKLDLQKMEANEFIPVVVNWWNKMKNQNIHRSLREADKSIDDQVINLVKNI